MPPQPEFPLLAFAASGTILLQSTATAVTAWDFETRQPRYTNSGRLVGVSFSGKTFVTEQGPETYTFWESATGAAQPLTATLIDDLPFDVRYRANLKEIERGRYAGQWIDVTGQQAPMPFALQARVPMRLEKIDNWLIVSPQRWLACAWFWAEDDFDGAYGNYHAVAGEAPAPVSLAVSRFHTVPPMYFSREHDWLVTGEQTGFNIYTASTGQPLGTWGGKFHLSGGGGDVVAFHPQERLWLAVNRDPVLSKDAEQQGFYLLDLNTPAREARLQQTFPETQPVQALAFHPTGTWIVDWLKSGDLHVWDVAQSQRVGVFATRA